MPGHRRQHPSRITPVLWPRYDRAYRLGDYIGSGADGAVYTCNKRRDRNSVYAAKFMRSRARIYSPTETLYEAHIIGNVLSIQRFLLVGDSYMYTSVDRSGILITEFCNAYDLYTLMSNHEQRRRFVREGFIWHFLWEMSSGLAYIHSKKIIHQDIKPANIFLSWRHNDQTVCSCHDYPFIKIADFGHSIMQGDPGLGPYIGAGTPLYQPPERPSTSYKTDIWALGAIVHQLMFTTLPIPLGFDWWDEEAFLLCHPMQRFPAPYCHPWTSAYSYTLYRVMLACLWFTQEGRVSGHALKQLVRDIRPARIMMDYQSLPQWVCSRTRQR